MEDVKWATIEEINELIKNEAFSESHTEFFELCLDYLKLKIGDKNVRQSNYI